MRPEITGILKWVGVFLVSAGVALVFLSAILNTALEYPMIFASTCVIGCVVDWVLRGKR